MKEDLDNYFLGNLSENEKNILLDKIESTADYKKEFIRIQNTVTLTRLFPQKSDAEWSDRMIAELNEKIKRKQSRNQLLTLLKYAAVFILLIGNGWLISEKVTEYHKDIQYTIIEVPKGQRISMTLTDGTEVWLSPRSTLRIPEKFNKKDRSVELDGEGYFSVTKDTKKPFIVETRDYDIKVLGTRFNVFAYEQSARFETDLVEGKVQITNRNLPGRNIILNPGEKLSLKTDKLVRSVSCFDNEEYLKNGIFSVTDKPLGEILEYLSLWYDVRFEIKDPEMEKYYISGKFRVNDEVRNILKGFQGVHAFEFRERNEQVIEIY